MGLFQIGWERWHKSSQFDCLNGSVPYLVEPKRPSTAAGHPFPWDPPLNKYPSLYPSKEYGELPSWIIYDKKVGKSKKKYLPIYLPMYLVFLVMAGTYPSVDCL